MRSMKRGLAIFLAVLLMIPRIPVKAEDEISFDASVVEEVTDTGESEEMPEEPSEEEKSEEAAEEPSETEKSEEAAEEPSETEKSEEAAEEPSETEKSEEEVKEPSETEKSEEEVKEPSETEKSEEAAEDSSKTEKSEEDKEEAEQTEETVQRSETVSFNTGNYSVHVVDEKNLEEAEEIWGAADCFDENGNYEIRIPEANPFFPYEVEFRWGGEWTREWFMDPADTVEIAGHTFSVKGEFDGKTVTQMKLNVAGDTIVVYPERKSFTEGGGSSTYSLLPLKERRLETIDLSGYTPVELTMVQVSFFAGENILDSVGKFMWTGRYDDNYTIHTSGAVLNLSYGTDSGRSDWEMIVGDDDQLAADNIRYLVSVETDRTENWLVPTVYMQSNTGVRTDMKVKQGHYNDNISNFFVNRSLRIVLPGGSLPEDYWETRFPFYAGLKINKDIFPDAALENMKAYEGRYSSAEEAMKSRDITAQIFSADMTKTNAGYQLRELHSTADITLVSFDDAGSPTGCLPFMMYMSSTGSEISMGSLYKETSSGRDYDFVDTYSISERDNCQYITWTLYKGYAANDFYFQYMRYNAEDADIQPIAYLGSHSSIAKAKEVAAEEITDVLFREGYEADYSKGVYFTVFLGEDGAEEQKVYRYCFQTEEGENPKEDQEDEEILNSGTYLSFYGLRDADGRSVPVYIVDKSQDSYAEFNYLTMLVGEDTDLTKLAPVFTMSSGMHLYAAGASTQEVSGKSCHDFSKGAVQYSASAEDGKSSQNYWLHIVKATDGAGWLYMNSLDDPDSAAKTENGVSYSKREVMLDSYHDNKHDIFLANMGKGAVENLKVELSSNVVVLDDYWTLSGAYGLSGFTTTEKTTDYGELPNLAKIRLKAKDGVDAGTKISGTLTVKSGNTPLMVITLTGLIGNPTITTKEVPAAVKYVPYGTMIQNSNKYSWNQVEYSLLSGNLPDGMVIKQNGELYGVPKETGAFTFTVIMSNSYYDFGNSTKTFTLNVIENTDANVDAATDTGYDLSQRIQNVLLVSGTNNSGTQTMVSQGVFDEFVDIYLDGKKLEEGTDYTAKSGSTRITIKSQTLAYAGEGTHTLGIEFRTQETDTLKRAAQNYTVSKKETGNGGNPSNGGGSDGSGSNGNHSGGSGSSGSSNGNHSGGSGSSGSSNGNHQGSGSGNAGSSGSSGTYGNDSSETVTYTVVPGDSLWKIAVKFYGNGSYWKRIYQDNRDVIKNPDRIRVGMKLVINAGQNVSSTTVPDASYDSSYTVVKGDTLWKIAKKVYGNGKFWKKIHELNRGIIRNPALIYAGQVFRVQ